jgi:SAM-dependent methyltransferase
MEEDLAMNDTRIGFPILDRPESEAGSLRMLVAIASYGEKNLHFLKEIIAEYRRMALQVDIVVLTNAAKSLGADVDVRVGLPTKNPWSLPFAHKPIFAAAADRYDLFLYSEDDIRITEAHIRALLRVTRHLQCDEVAGYLRYEVDHAGNRWLPDVHGAFHWKPDAVKRRGPYVLGEFTNEHAACYVLTRAQLHTALRSGGFLTEPHEGRYDMLCSAATDPYTRCGLRKVVCISELDDFLVHHMSNRYAGEVGLALAQCRVQIEAQFSILEGREPASTAFETESRMLTRQWSKDYYEPASDAALEMIRANDMSILSVGCGAGANEIRLRDRGAAVTAIPLDSIIGVCAARQGIEVVAGRLEECLARLQGRRFDCVLITNLLHLRPQSAPLLEQLAGLTRARSFVICGPNFRTLRVWAKRALRRSSYHKLGSFEESGINMVGPPELRRALHTAGLEVREVRWFTPHTCRALEERMGVLGSTSWALRAARPGEA